jgi:acyl transferase domain-containing protein
MGDIRPSDKIAPGEQQSMPVAIIGMACRLPGQVSTLQEFWELCARGRSGWSEMPKDRFNPEGFYHPNPDRTGCFNPKGGHFLDEDIALFDAPFFNTTLQEARAMDPQQRLLLECSYEALENGGIAKQAIQGHDVGVFIGGSPSDYEINNLRDTATIPMHQITGCAISLQSNRISYYFDLKGPSITIDTACSSSLSALHLACQSLQSKDCSTALVGGCHLNVLPDTFVSMSMSRLFSESGRSYPFDQRAKSQDVPGYGRGEGVAMIVLKPLQDALDAGDSIRAVIMGTGMNQDGRTRGITSPNGEAQADLIRSVYRRALIDPHKTGYVEAHGTGTKIGDPTEAQALHSVFSEGRASEQPLFLGSVKSNIGHAEGACGVIAVVKATMMLERGFVLPNFNFKQANDEIPMDKWSMKVRFPLWLPL